jgi:hypothetical protein
MQNSDSCLHCHPKSASLVYWRASRSRQKPEEPWPGTGRTRPHQPFAPFALRAQSGGAINAKQTLVIDNHSAPADRNEQAPIAKPRLLLRQLDQPCADRFVALLVRIDRSIVESGQAPRPGARSSRSLHIRCLGVFPSFLALRPQTREHLRSSPPTFISRALRSNRPAHLRSTRWM